MPNITSLKAGQHIAEENPVVAELLAPLIELTKKSQHFWHRPLGAFRSDEEKFELSSFLFLGPKIDRAPIRLGIFTGLRGNEPECVQALVHFIQELERHPELAAGFTLYLYPACNPTALADQTALARGGYDLPTQFWQHAPTSEIKMLEREIRRRSFNGIISLQADHTEEVLSGNVSSPVIGDSLLAPAFVASTGHLLTATIRSNDTNGRQGFRFLTPPGAEDGLAQPFELGLNISPAIPAASHRYITTTVLLGVISRYRDLLAIGENI